MAITIAAIITRGIIAIIIIIFIIIITITTTTTKIINLY